MSTALIIEDDPQIRRFVRTTLQESGWTVHEADTIARGLVEAGTRQPDLVVLDLGLPDGDGVGFVEEFRRWSSVPVIVLSARIEESAKVRALDAGADDYLTKPFGVGEFMARVRANARRGRSAEVDATVRFGAVEVDLARRSIRKAGVEVHLTPIEYRLLGVMIANAGRVVTQRHLLQEVWGPGHAERLHYLRIYMGHLRRKLEDDPAQPRHLLTETAVGYRLLLD